MKRWILLALIAITLGMVIGSLAGQDSGFVMLSWGQYSIETSLWFFIVLMVASFVLMYLLLRMLLLLIGSDWRFNDWKQRRRRAAARKKTMQGLISMAQGQWSRAERQLTRSADDTDIPLINYLAAAKAAYEQGHHEATSDLLQRASKTTRGAELPAGMAKAQFLISRDQPEQALAVLVSLRDKYPRHSYLLKVLVRLYEKLEDWVALKNLLPVLGKSGPYSAEQLHELSIKVYVQLIDRLMHGHSDLDQAHELKAMFHGLPRNYRKSRRVLLAYGKALHQLGKDELAEVELRTGLKHAWSDELIELYGELITPETGRQKLFAEKQLTERPNDPTLLLVLARLSVRTGELDQANEYVETGLSLKPTAGLLTLQADILAASEQFQQAAEIYKKAMELTERQQG